MAKKKNLEDIEETPMLSNPESETQTDETPSEANIENEADETPSEANIENEADETPSEANIENEENEPQKQLETPTYVLEYMKRHPELKGVYVDKFGGTYPEDIDQAFVKDAILYQNPYFKN